MNVSELAIKMLDWETKKIELDAIEAEIKEAVLDLKATQTAGNVIASYSKGRRELDYETPGKNAPIDYIHAHTVANKFVDWDAVASLIDPDIIEECTRETEQVNWSDVCKDAKIKPVVVKEGNPSVTMKMK